MVVDACENQGLSRILDVFPGFALSVHDLWLACVQSSESVGQRDEWKESRFADKTGEKWNGTPVFPDCSEIGMMIPVWLIMIGSIDRGREQKPPGAGMTRVFP